jgi:hypothetical protein
MPHGVALPDLPEKRYQKTPRNRIAVREHLTAPAGAAQPERALRHTASLKLTFHALWLRKSRK